MINEKKDGSLRSKAETGTGISVLSVSDTKKKPTVCPSEPVIFTRLPSPLRPPPGVIRRFSLPVATSTTFVMVGNPSSVPATITLMFFKSSLNSIRGEQRKVTLLTDGSNLASGPINGPSTPSELLANPNSTVEAL